jgi:hypothetical protein
MRTWTTETTVSGLPEEVLDLLCQPDAIRRWAPIPFEVEELDADRLVAGAHARVSGQLAGRTMSFDVEVFEADDGRLALAATGPVSIDVEYVVTPVADGAELRASVTVEGRGLMGRVLAQATDAVLAAGALNAAVGRIARELEPQPLAA